MPDNVQASPGPQIAQRESDRQTMLSALERVKARGRSIAQAMRVQGKEHPFFTSPRADKPHDIPYMTHTRHRVMAGRRHPDQINDLNAGLNVGSTHLMMPAEPHGPTHRKEIPPEGQVTLPKDQ